MLKQRFIGFITAAAALLTASAIGVMAYFSCFQNSEVIFIPGWKSKGHVSKLIKKEIKEIFSVSKVTINQWKSDGDWQQTKENADNEAHSLSTKIFNMPSDAQKNLVLIGHSIGAGVVVRTAKLLYEKNIKIKQIILLGAAVDHDDPDLKFCAEVSEKEFINVYNRNDNILKIVYGNKERTMAAGFSGIKEKYKNMKQYRRESQSEILAGFMEHQNFEYVEFLSDIIKGNVKEYIEEVDHHKIKVNTSWFKGPYFLPENIFLIIPDEEKGESYHDWKFCQYAGFYFIINPYGEVKFSFREKPMQNAWNSIKQQIDSQLAAANSVPAN